MLIKGNQRDGRDEKKHRAWGIESEVRDRRSERRISNCELRIWDVGCEKWDVRKARKAGKGNDRDGRDERDEKKHRA